MVGWNQQHQHRRRNNTKKFALPVTNDPVSAEWADNHRSWFLSVIAIFAPDLRAACTHCRFRR
jgi:hypothetical protein